MFKLSRLVKFLPALILIGMAPDVLGQGASPWIEGHRSRVRLVAGGTEGQTRLAGIEIGLDPGFKTYWRNPGESGLPPAFDWSKSTNLEAAEVLWPAPSRSEDAGGVSYGYHGQVMFPVRARPKDATKPVSLGLKIDYGVCKDICIPARAELALKMPKDVSAEAAAAIERALARVPRRQALGSGGDPAILGATPITRDGKSILAVKARATGDSKLFVEAPEKWFLLPASQPETPSQNGIVTFLVDVLERPSDATGPVDLRLTLVAGHHAVETTATLDAAQLPR